MQHQISKNSDFLTDGKFKSLLLASLLRFDYIHISFQLIPSILN